jgi:hypothetical protein
MPACLLVRGRANAIEIAVEYREGEKHIPVVTLRRAV